MEFNLLGFILGALSGYIVLKLTRHVFKKKASVTWQGPAAVWVRLQGEFKDYAVLVHVVTKPGTKTEWIVTAPNENRLLWANKVENVTDRNVVLGAPSWRKISGLDSGGRPQILMLGVVYTVPLVIDDDVTAE